MVSPQKERQREVATEMEATEPINRRLRLAALLVRQAATSTFFLLMMISFVDVIGGFAITARTARLDVAVEEAVVPADRG